jgi:chemotaxis protein MotB
MGKKKKTDDEGDSSSLIQVMTVSLFIILLAFFILLNSIAVLDDQRRRTALGSLMENFGILSGGFSTLNQTNKNIPAEKITQITRLLDFSDLIKNEDDPVNDLIVVSEPKRSVVTLPAQLLFEPGETELKPGSYTVLNRLCRVVKETKYSADIAGYMDKGSGASDASFSTRELSVLRALSVYRYFSEIGKIHPKLITAYGWGEHHPVASNKVRESRALNQRIEVVIAHNKRLEKPEGIFTFKNFFFNVFDK